MNSRLLIAFPQALPAPHDLEQEEIPMSVAELKALANKHWKEWLPNKVKELKRGGQTERSPTGSGEFGAGSNQPSNGQMPPRLDCPLSAKGGHCMQDLNCRKSRDRIPPLGIRKSYL